MRSACNARYYVDELYPSEKAWLPSILEPVRLRYMNGPQPPPLQIFLQDPPLPLDATCAYMVGKQPDQPGVWREIFVYRVWKVRARPPTRVSADRHKIATRSRPDQLVCASIGGARLSHRGGGLALLPRARVHVGRALLLPRDAASHKGARLPVARMGAPRRGPPVRGAATRALVRGDARRDGRGQPLPRHRDLHSTPPLARRAARGAHVDAAVRVLAGRGLPHPRLPQARRARQGAQRECRGPRALHTARKGRPRRLPRRALPGDRHAIACHS